MKWNLDKFKFFQKLDRLEVYLLAADNPIGKKQLRPIFRRKRSREVLTREQVTAIKKGRRVLRREMKAQGLKRRIDFEVTATNLGLYFDRNRLLWPFFLWLIRDHTVAKLLTTSVLLTTLLTTTVPLIRYLTQYLTEYLDKIVYEYLDKLVEKEVDRFTINLSEEMLNKGLELSETPGFEDPKEVLVCVPAWDVPCVSISEIPADVDMTDGEHHDIYFAYTFYCRYINKDAEKENEQGMEEFDLTKYAIDYDWGLVIGREGLDTSNTEETTPDAVMLAEETEASEETEPADESSVKVSDAVWVMVIQDGEVIVCAKARSDGSVETLPTEEVLTTKKMAFMDRSVDYINQGLKQIDSRLSMDNVSRLDTLFETQAEIDACQAEIDAYFATAGISDLTQLMLRTENWQDRYKVVATRGDHSYYQVVPESFVSESTVVQRTRTEVLPYLEDSPNMHKYTVVIWLEGDDPECTNELMNGNIQLSFQIKGEAEDFMTDFGTSETPDATEGTEATESTGASETAGEP